MLLHLFICKISYHIAYQHLIQSCLSGNRSSQNELYGHFAPAMFTVCLRYAKNRNEAEEMMQTGFIKVFAALQQYRGDGSFEGWIKRIMVTSALQHLRSHTSLRAIVSADSNVAEEVHEKEIIESNLNAKELMALVQTLPIASRMVFNLYVFDGYQHNEIAGMLGISEGTSKSNLYDARKWLKKRLMTANQLKNRKEKSL